MREVAFIKQNKNKWLEIEQVIAGKLKKNPDDLSSLYINLINDLSYAQTYYSKSKTTVYLNHLSSLVFQKIYKTKRTESNRVVEFFKTEVPLLMHRHSRYLVFTFLIFVLMTAIGVISSAYELDFVRIILGDGYVDQTLENIKKGNPIAVYDHKTMWAMAWVIIQNNITVGAKMFIYGAFAGIGTLYYLMYNAIMLGSFQYFFHTQGVLTESMRGIWVHGTFEISSMIVEATAGFILGASILFPKTYSRVVSFKIGFKNAFKIFLSTLPFTFLAGLLEGFVTRFALKIPLLLNLTIIFGTLGIIFYYYAVYPQIVYKKHKK